MVARAIFWSLFIAYTVAVFLGGYFAGYLHGVADGFVER